MNVIIPQSNTGVNFLPTTTYRRREISSAWAGGVIMHEIWVPATTKADRRQFLKEV
jgi:hypothetical protein